MSADAVINEDSRASSSLPDGWVYRELDDLLIPNGLAYGVVQPGSEDPMGVPVLRVKNIRRGRVLTDEVLRIKKEIEASYQRTRLAGGEVLLSLVGSVGEVAVAPPSVAGWNVARAIAVIRVGNSISSSWLQFCLESEMPQHFMRIWQTNTVQATLNLRDVRRLPIAIPPERERDAIVAVLRALDDKISANAQLTQACDALRCMRLKYWIQSNWQAVKESPLSSMGEFVNGRAFTKDATGIGRMVIRIAEINSGPSTSTIYNDIEVPGVHLARPGDVLFAWSGSLTVARWFRAEGIVNQHIFKVIPRYSIPTWLIFELINSKLAMFKGIAADKATTMGHIQRRHLDEPVLVPAPEHIPELDAAFGPLWERALLAEQESLKLAELRDTLLPKLMSGEIRVREAEKVVEDVT